MGARNMQLATVTIAIFCCVIAVKAQECDGISGNISCSTNTIRNETANEKLIESTTKSKVREAGIPSDDEIFPISVNKWNKNRRSYKNILRYPDRSRLLRHVNGTYFRTVIQSAKKIIQELLKNNLTEGLVCIPGSGTCVKASLDDLSKLGTMQLRDMDRVSFAIAATFDIIMIIVGISGNLLLVVGVLLSKRFQNSTGVLVSGLAVSDILALCICVPMELIVFFFEQSIRIGQAGCYFLQFVKYFTLLVSTGGMSALALDRFIAVCIPLKAKMYCTVSRARFTVTLVWLISGALSVPVVYFAKYMEKYGAGVTEASCYIRFPDLLAQQIFRVYLMVVVFVIPLCVMLPTYLKIFVVLWKSIKSANKLQNPNAGPSRDEERKSESTKSRMQVIRMLLVVLAFFVVCWGPYVIFQAIPRQNSYQTIKYALLSLAHANSFVNPLIYVTMSSSFRDIMLNVFGVMCRCRRIPSNRK